MELMYKMMGEFDKTIVDFALAGRHTWALRLLREAGYIIKAEVALGALLDACVDAGIEDGGVEVDALFRSIEGFRPYWREASYYLAARLEGHRHLMSRDISPDAEARILCSLFPDPMSSRILEDPSRILLDLDPTRSRIWWDPDPIPDGSH